MPQPEDDFKRKSVIDRVRFARDEEYWLLCPRLIFPKEVIDRERDAIRMCHPSNVGKPLMQRADEVFDMLQESMKWHLKKKHDVIRRKPFGAAQWHDTAQRNGVVRITQTLDIMGLPYERKSVGSTIIHFHLAKLGWAHNKFQLNQIFARDDPKKRRAAIEEKMIQDALADGGLADNAPNREYARAYVVAELDARDARRKAPSNLDPRLGYLSGDPRLWRDDTVTHDRLCKALMKQCAELIDHVGDDHRFFEAWIENADAFDALAVEMFGSAYPFDDARKAASREKFQRHCERVGRKSRAKVGPKIAMTPVERKRKQREKERAAKAAIIVPLESSQEAQDAHVEAEAIVVAVEAERESWGAPEASDEASVADRREYGISDLDFLVALVAEGGEKAMATPGCG